MRSGKLDQVVGIWRATHGVNAAGTPVMSWAEYTTLRAEVVRLSTAEILRSGGGAVDENELLFRTRFVPGITTADRVFFDGRFYKIKGLQPMGRNRSLEIRALAIEAEADGPAEFWAFEPGDPPS